MVTDGRQGLRSRSASTVVATGPMGTLRTGSEAGFVAGNRLRSAEDLTGRTGPDNPRKDRPTERRGWPFGRSKPLKGESPGALPA